MKPAKISSISAEQDEWIRKAMRESIAAAKNVVGATGPIRPHEPIGKLSDAEWGWICSSAVWGWISARSEQASAEGWNIERAIRATQLDPCPWDLGAVRKILAELARACTDLDWTKPVNAWSKNETAGFLLAGFGLIKRAHAARDAAEGQVAGKPTNADIAARHLNGAAGNPRMTIEEFLDESCPPF